MWVAQSSHSSSSGFSGNNVSGVGGTADVGGFVEVNDPGVATASSYVGGLADGAGEGEDPDAMAFLQYFAVITCLCGGFGLAVYVKFLGYAEPSRFWFDLGQEKDGIGATGRFSMVMN